MQHQRVVVMGVSGSGKSTVGQGLAEMLGWRYIEGDALHPPENVARMAAGIALTDDDRQGWLDRIAGELTDARAGGRGAVVACSALKRAYRERLRRADPALRFVWLHGAEPLLAGRLQARQGHYMPPSLLASQLQTLEAPADEEAVIALDIAQPVPELVAAARQALETP
jgi:gluconokinase